MNVDLLEIAKALPLSEKVEFFDAIWESLRSEDHEPTLSATQAIELDRRLVAHRSNPADVISWEEVKAATERRPKKPQ